MLTVAEREEMLNTISDLSKSAYGFRVRRDYAAMSDLELEAEWDYFLEVADRRTREEAEQEAIALKAWNLRIAALAKNYGIGIATAVQWDIQASDCEGQGFDYYMWDQGIGFEDGRRIARELGYWKEVA